MKGIARLLYDAIYIFLQRTWTINPLIAKRRNNRKIFWGHVRIEQETNPYLNKEIVRQLGNNQIACFSYYIDINGFKKYFAEVKYPMNYYGDSNLKEEFIEKSLEHFVSFDFLNLTTESILVDVGAGNSPFYKIVQERSGSKAYRQDKLFANGLNGNTIGGSATKLPLPDASVNAITLHCAFEHFENKEDIEFLAEAERVLKPGAKCVVLPFYLASEYTVHLDPVKNLLNFSNPSVLSDSSAVLRYCDSRQRFSRHYDVKTFKERLINQMKNLDTKIFFVENFKDVHRDCYLRFIAVFTKI